MSVDPPCYFKHYRSGVPASRTTLEAQQHPKIKTKPQKILQISKAMQYMVGPRPRSGLRLSSLVDPMAAVDGPSMPPHDGGQSATRSSYEGYFPAPDTSSRYGRRSTEATGQTVSHSHRPRLQRLSKRQYNHDRFCTYNGESLPPPLL